ncbi:hypothetical protein [Aquiflexum sp.]|uniref:hypothetical protein n=1 Tax=Aquiflexum sp. TaxID=1872584 RepID=UPI0035948E7F
MKSQLLLPSIIYKNYNAAKLVLRVKKNPKKSIVQIKSDISESQNNSTDEIFKIKPERRVINLDFLGRDD